MSDSDPVFKRYQIIYGRLVETLKKQNLSPLETFQLIDQNKDGKIGKTEFALAMNKLRIPMNEDELDTLFSFLDLDNTQTIEYQEFLRKLRRSGVSVRR